MAFIEYFELETVKMLCLEGIRLSPFSLLAQKNFTTGKSKEPTIF
jgi:hypothetical protein